MARSSRLLRVVVSCAPVLVMAAGCGVSGMFGFSQGDLANLSITQRFGTYVNLASRLLMTSDQVTKARELDAKLKADLQARRDSAQQDFLNVLTPDQKTLFTQVAQENPEVKFIYDWTNSSSGGFFAFFGGHDGNRVSAQTVETRLGLTADQTTSVENIRSALTDGIAAIRAASDDSFRALLDAGQNTLLDNILNPQQGTKGSGE